MYIYIYHTLYISYIILSWPSFGGPKILVYTYNTHTIHNIRASATVPFVGGNMESIFHIVPQTVLPLRWPFHGATNYSLSRQAKISVKAKMKKSLFYFFSFKGVLRAPQIGHFWFLEICWNFRKGILMFLDVLSN